MPRPKKKILEKLNRPSDRKDIEGVDFQKLADEEGLTEMQAKFAYFYVFLTGMNGAEAVRLAGYSLGNYENYDEKLRNYYETAVARSHAKKIYENPKVLSLITKLRKELGNEVIVDKLYVIQNLKRLAETGSENVQLRALEKLGETMDMFKQVQVVEERVDPSEIASAKFEKRMKNTVEFKKEGTSE